MQKEVVGIQYHWMNLDSPLPQALIPQLKTVQGSAEISRWHACKSVCSTKGVAKVLQGLFEWVKSSLVKSTFWGLKEIDSPLGSTFDELEDWRLQKDYYKIWLNDNLESFGECVWARCVLTSELQLRCKLYSCSPTTTADERKHASRIWKVWVRTLGCVSQCSLVSSLLTTSSCAVLCGLAVLAVMLHPQATRQSKVTNSRGTRW